MKIFGFQITRIHKPNEWTTEQESVFNAREYAHDRCMDATNAQVMDWQQHEPMGSLLARYADLECIRRGLPRI